jgi:hypothetical protein
LKNKLRNAVENELKKSFFNYESPAMPLSYRPTRTNGEKRVYDRMGASRKESLLLGGATLFGLVMRMFN